MPKSVFCSKIEIGFSIDVWETSVSKPKLIIFKIWNGKPEVKNVCNCSVPTILMHHDAFIGKVN